MASHYNLTIESMDHSVPETVQTIYVNPQRSQGLSAPIYIKHNTKYHLVFVLQD